MLLAVQDVAGQAQDVMDALQATVTLQHPTANAGGPYNGSEGVAISFDASASSDPTGQALSYEWDFDLDGEFDDATGAMVSNTYGAPFSGKVGLKVTDPDGNSDISNASAEIADVNNPPQITAYSPGDLAPREQSEPPRLRRHRDRSGRRRCFIRMAARRCISEYGVSLDIHSSRRRNRDALGAAYRER
jgi:hypothetical protein